MKGSSLLPLCVLCLPSPSSALQPGSLLFMFSRLMFQFTYVKSTPTGNGGVSVFVLSALAFTRGAHGSFCCE